MIKNIYNREDDKQMVSPNFAQDLETVELDIKSKSVSSFDS